MKQYFLLILDTFCFSSKIKPFQCNAILQLENADNHDTLLSCCHFNFHYLAWKAILCFYGKNTEKEFYPPALMTSSRSPEKGTYSTRAKWVREAESKLLGRSGFKYQLRTWVSWQVFRIFYFLWFCISEISESAKWCQFHYADKSSNCKPHSSLWMPIFTTLCKDLCFQDTK